MFISFVRLFVRVCVLLEIASGCVIEMMMVVAKEQKYRLVLV